MTKLDGPDILIYVAKEEVLDIKSEQEKKMNTLNQTDLTDQEDPLTHLALGTYRGKGGWQLVKIAFNPETGTVGKLEKLGEPDDRIIVNERFKIAAIDNKIVG